MPRPSQEVSYKKDAMRAAAELGYGKYVVDRIEKAKDDLEIRKIMIDARHRKFKMDEVF